MDPLPLPLPLPLVEVLPLPTSDEDGLAEALRPLPVDFEPVIWVVSSSSLKETALPSPAALLPLKPYKKSKSPMWIVGVKRC